MSDHRKPTDQPPELMVDGYAKAPRPLDHRIAAVSLRTRTNNPTEGYELSLSAQFGKERVTLKADGLEIDVAFSLNSANLDLLLANCTLAIIDDPRLTEDRKQTTTETTTVGTRRKSAGVIGSEINISPESMTGAARAGARLEADAAMETKIVTERQAVQADWHRLGPDALKVGRSEIKPGQTNKVLEGPIITDFVGWLVKPEKGVTSSVTARVRVRADWINFDDVHYGDPPLKWKHKFEDLLKPEKRLRRQHFQVLLKHLAQGELKEHQEDREATIAAAVLIVKPTEDHPDSLPTGEQRREIRIPGKPIEQFLASEEGHEAGTLIGLGVKRDSIVRVDEPALDKPRSQRGKNFVPESSPPNVLALFSKMYHGPNRRPDPTRNELRDLRSLGLISRKRGSYEVVATTTHVEPELILRRAVSEMSCIKVARAVLRVNPGATGIDIADAVALELNMDWKQVATKKRNGNAIKRWTIWLEPHLIDASASGEAAAVVAYARKSFAIKGRPPVFDAPAEKKVRAMLKAGSTVAEIAEQFKVSRQTIYMWKKRRGL